MDKLNTPELNAAGAATTCLALLNSVFTMLNPVLTGLFYVASIGWLLTQIYYKIKKKQERFGSNAICVCMCRPVSNDGFSYATNTRYFHPTGAKSRAEATIKLC